MIFGIDLAIIKMARGLPIEHIIKGMCVGEDAAFNFPFLSISAGILPYCILIYGYLVKG